MNMVAFELFNLRLPALFLGLFPCNSHDKNKEKKALFLPVLYNFSYKPCLLPISIFIIFVMAVTLFLVLHLLYIVKPQNH